MSDMMQDSESTATTVEQRSIGEKEQEKTKGVKGVGKGGSGGNGTPHSRFAEGRLKLSTSCTECHRRKQKVFICSRFVGSGVCESN